MVDDLICIRNPMCGGKSRCLRNGKSIGKESLELETRVQTPEASAVGRWAGAGPPIVIFGERRLVGSATSHGPKRCRYSLEVMKALTISAATKLPLN